MKDKNQFMMINDDGDQVVCDILFTFDSEDTNKSYIVYTDNSKDEDGNIQVFASIYNPELEDQNLEPITTEKEWQVIEIILDEIQATIQEKLKEHEDSHNHQQE